MLVDTDADEVYLGELNPRISGASAITNVTAGAYADVPLFAFHLLEFMDIDVDFDVDEINERWEELAAVDVWCQMIIKETEPVGSGSTPPPRRASTPWTRAARWPSGGRRWTGTSSRTSREAFFLRIYGPGDFRWKGADLGVLVTKGRLQTGTPGSPPRPSRR